MVKLPYTLVKKKTEVVDLQDTDGKSVLFRTIIGEGFTEGRDWQIHKELVQFSSRFEHLPIFGPGLGIEQNLQPPNELNPYWQLSGDHYKYIKGISNRVSNMDTSKSIDEELIKQIDRYNSDRSDDNLNLILLSLPSFCITALSESFNTNTNLMVTFIELPRSSAQRFSPAVPFFVGCWFGSMAPRDLKGNVIKSSFTVFNPDLITYL